MPAATTENIILQGLVTDDNFLRSVYPYIKPEYFEVPARALYLIIGEYFEKYSKSPSVQEVEVELSNRKLDELIKLPGKLDENVHSEAKKILDYIQQKNAITPTNPQWLLDETEKWCKSRAIYLALAESIEIADGRHKTKKEDSIPEILSDALSVGFLTKLGQDYFADAEDRFKRYHKKVNKVPFRLDSFNRMTNGGVEVKTLNVLMAGIYVGKTLALCSLASDYLMSGKKVLYISLELSEDKVCERIDANLLDVPIDDIETMPPAALLKISKVREAQTTGRLKVMEYGSGTAHVGHFRHLCRELRLKDKFSPDVIIVDYINLMLSSRLKIGSSAGEKYGYIKGISEELRAFAKEMVVPIWSATQVNRESYSDSDFDMDGVAESWGLPATVDLLWGLIQTEDLSQFGQYMVKQMKNRYKDVGFCRRFIIGVDKARMRLYDVSKSAQAVVTKQAVASPQQHQPGNTGRSWPSGKRPFSENSGGSTNRFSKLKV